MGNSNNQSIYSLRIIFYGNIPEEIPNRINNNNNIIYENHEYYFYRKYKWYIYLTQNNSNVNTIENIIQRRPFINHLPSKKSVVICFINLRQAINLLQYYQIQFSKGKREQDIPYFVFNQQNLGVNNRTLWEINIEYNNVNRSITISAINEKLQLYQTDFIYEDFLLCKIFRNFNNLEEICRKLNELKDRNRYRLRINPNTEKLEMIFNINPQNNDEANQINNNFGEKSDEEDEDETPKGKCGTPIKQKSTKSDQKTYQRILANDSDAKLIIEQNVFIFVLIKDLFENRLALNNVLLDAANYFNYLPLTIDEDRVCFSSFNIMLVGRTRSGKSTLMNKIAGKNITRSCEGSLRTEDLFMQDILNGKINMYDTCGSGGQVSTKNIYYNINKKLELLNKNGIKNRFIINCY